MRLWPWPHLPRRSPRRRWSTSTSRAFGRATETMQAYMLAQGNRGFHAVFNPLVADSTGGDDNLVVAGTNLLDRSGRATTSRLAISPVGGDHGRPNRNTRRRSTATTSSTIRPATLRQPVHLLQSAASARQPPPTSTCTTALVRSAATRFRSHTVVGTYNSIAGSFLDDVPVVGGSITGLFGVGTTGVVGGITRPHPADFACVVRPGSNQSQQSRRRQA